MAAKLGYIAGPLLAFATVAGASEASAAPGKAEVTRQDFGKWTLLCREQNNNAAQPAECAVTMGIIDREDNKTLRLIFMPNAENLSQGSLIMETSRDQLDKLDINPTITLHYPDAPYRVLNMEIGDRKCVEGKGCSYAIDLSAQGMHSFFTSAAINVEMPESNQDGKRYHLEPQGLADALTAMGYQAPSTQP